MVSTLMGMDDESSLLHGYPKIYVEVCVESSNVTSTVPRAVAAIRTPGELASRGGMSPGRAGEYR